MKPAIELLEELQAQDVHITLIGRKLKINAPKGTLNPVLVERLRALKSDLLEELVHSKDNYKEKDRHHRHHRHSPSEEVGEKSLWDPETSDLVQWFLEEGQHRIPTEPFQLTPWQRVVDPELFKESIHFGISMGPDKVGQWRGTFTADLRRLKELFGSNSSEGEKSK